MVVLLLPFIGSGTTFMAEAEAGTGKQDPGKVSPSQKRGKKPARKQTADPPAVQPEPVSPAPAPLTKPVTPAPVMEPLSRADEVYFSVLEFHVEGNTLLPQEKVDQVLEPYKGFAQKIADIDKARAALEKTYHELGYPTALVTVPEQTVETGTVRLKVIESRIGEVSVTGNRYYSTERILDKLPSLRPGAIIYEPTLSKELADVNANPDRQVSPVLKPGKDQEAVDLELKVKDRLPLHAKITGDNKGAITTPSNRLTMEVQYTNLWDKEHILTLQTVQTPTNWGAVQTYGFTYVAPFKHDRLFSLYFAKSMSNSVLAGTGLPAGGGEIGIAGNATITGIRYTEPFKTFRDYHHQMTFGADYKRLEQTTAQFPSGLGTAVVSSPIQYTPLSVSYSGYVPHDLGVTSGSMLAKGYVAGTIPGGSKQDFAGNPNDPFNQPGNRKGSTGTFVVFQGSLDRTQQLPEGFLVTAHMDGQWANEPLIAAEEYFAGGMDTVRGYKQYETIGDDAARFRVEGLTPPVTIPFDRMVNARLKLDVRFAAFYDAAFLWVLRPQPGQADRFQLEGVGGGVRARLDPLNLNIRIDEGFALRNATLTQKGDTFLHFMLEMAF
jgi:hemolysin activation/secretion protein